LVEHLEDEDAPEAVLLVYEKDPGKAFPPEARKKIAMLKAESVPFWSSQRKKWLLGLAAKQGISLADEAAALLVELTEDPEEVRAELASLGIYADGARVDADMVRRLSYDEGRNLVLKFLDSFCQARAAEVLAVFERLKGEPSVLPLLTALYNRIRPAVYLGVFPQAEAERVMVALEVKDYALKMAREALRNYRPEALSDMALGLLSLSWGEKTSYAEGWPGFEALVMRCMAGAGAKK
jgi:DNA polymerase-3 subunit delta